MVLLHHSLTMIFVQLWLYKWQSIHQKTWLHFYCNKTMVNFHTGCWASLETFPLWSVLHAMLFCIWSHCVYLQHISVLGCVACICSAFLYFEYFQHVLSNRLKCFLSLLVLFLFACVFLSCSTLSTLSHHTYMCQLDAHYEILPKVVSHLLCFVYCI